MIQYELSRLRLSISSTVLRLLSSCSDSSGLLAPPFEGQSFILSFLCHTSFLSFIILSSCPFAFGPPLPPGNLRLRATFAFGPPLPTGHLQPSHYSSSFSFLSFLFRLHWRLDRICTFGSPTLTQPTSIAIEFLLQIHA